MTKFDRWMIGKKSNRTYPPPVYQNIKYHKTLGVTDSIQVNNYVLYRGKIYEVVETNTLNNTAKLKFAEGDISRDISFDELQEVPF